MNNFFLAGAVALGFLAAGCGGGDAVSDSIAPVAGNWTDCRTGEWRYGFYDDMAIADGEFWDYGSVAVTASRADIVLRRGGESKHVVLRRGAAFSLGRWYVPRDMWRLRAGTTVRWASRRLSWIR